MLWVGQLLSNTGTQIGLLAYPLLILSLAHSAALAGAVVTARAVTQQEKGTLPATSGKREKGPEAEELARLRAENKKLRARNDRLENELGKTKTALDIAGKAFALLEDISGSADSGTS